MKKKENSNRFAGTEVNADTLEMLPIAVVIFDNKKVFFLNQKAKEILSLSSKQKLSELKPFDFFLPEFHKRIRVSNEKILKGQTFPPIEIRIKDKKGNVIDIEAKSNAVYFDGNHAVQATFQIITERKRLQKELEQKWNDYKELLDVSPFAYFIHHKGFCKMCNKEAVKILKEKSAEKILGKYLINYIIPEQRERALIRLKEATAGKEFDFVSYKIRTAKKNIVNVELKSAPVTYNGESCVLTLMKDVTEKEIYEKEKLRAEIAEEHNKKLLEEIEQRKTIERKLQTLFNTSTHIIWTIDNKYNFTSFNDNYKNQLIKYYNTKSFGNGNLKALYKKLLTKEDYKLWMTNYKKAFEGEYVVFETLKTLKSGEEIYREVYFNPIKDQSGKVKEVAAISHNVTERKLNEKAVKAQTAKLSAIFESSSFLVWTVNKKFQLTFFNQKYVEVFKQKYGVMPVLGKMAYEIIPQKFKTENKSLWHPKYEEVFKGEQVIFERQDRDKKGGELYREVYLNPIKGESGEIFEVACLAHDITENKNNQRQVIEQAAKIKAIFESGSHIMWTVNKDLAYTSFNNNFSKAIFNLYGQKPKLNKALTRPQNQYATAEYHNFWNGKYEEAFTGKAIDFITERTNIDGKKTFRQIFLHPIYNQDNEVIEVSGMGFDITDKVLNEQKATSQAAKLNAIFDGSSHYIWTVDKEGSLTSYNKNYSDLLKRIYGSEAKQGKAPNRGKMASDEKYTSWWDEQYSKAFSGNSLNFEIAIVDTAGIQIYFEVFLNPVYENNKIVEVSGVAHDITEKKLNEDRISQSLKEKEVLLKEVHHRVKNNMQVISSILNLQSSYVTDEYALALLKESQNRIKTMAYIHESLYQNKTFSSINFSEYVSTLANNILHSYSTGQKVKLVLDIQKIILNLDTSIPAGLIINELVTNCFKHAFNKDSNGIILINLHAESNTVRLEVSDNGKGFPKEIDFKNTNSLGLQLVNTLVEQLNGTIELKENKYKGTGFYISFPM